MLYINAVDADVLQTSFWELVHAATHDGDFACVGLLIPLTSSEENNK